MSAGFSWKWRAITPFLGSKQRLIRHHHTWIKRPLEQKFSRNKAEPHTNNKWAPRAAHGTKEKVGGPSGRPADLHVSRPAHGPHHLQASTWHSLIGSMSVQVVPCWIPGRAKGGSPLYIWGEGLHFKQHTSIMPTHITQAILSRCSSSSLVEVLGPEEFGFES